MLIGAIEAQLNIINYELKFTLDNGHFITGVQQVKDALNNGAQAVTVPVEVLKQIFANPNIEKAVNDFNQDWYAMYGDNIGICDLKD